MVEGILGLAEVEEVDSVYKDDGWCRSTKERSRATVLLRLRFCFTLALCGRRSRLDAIYGFDGGENTASQFVRSYYGWYKSESIQKPSDLCFTHIFQSLFTYKFSIPNISGEHQADKYAQARLFPVIIMGKNTTATSYPLNVGSFEANFSPPQAFYSPMKGYQSLHLKQISSKAQTLTFDKPHPTHPTYSIETTSTSFLGHKPDLAISREHNQISQKVAEGNFEKYQAVSKVKFRESEQVEELRLEDHQTQRVVAILDGELWGWWQPSQADNLLVEIVAPSNELIARFVYSNDHNFSDKVIKFGTVLGELQIDDQYASNQSVLDQVVCMTVTLVEREKRRQHKLRGEEGTAPVTSLNAGVTHSGDLELDGPAPPYED